jgi:hypothetical protein
MCAGRFHQPRTSICLDSGSIQALLATPSTPGTQMKSENKKSLRERQRRRPRIIGVTEQRLRARNQPSWMMNAKAWKKFMHGFTSPAKG